MRGEEERAHSLAMTSITDLEDPMTAFRLTLSVVVAALVPLGGCGSDGTATHIGPANVASTTAGSAAVETPVTQITLRIGTNDESDAPIGPAIDAFARYVDELSGGSIQIKPVWRAAGDPVPDDWDQVVATKVMNGSLDMGLIPSAAWDAEGVTTLRALNAPFLVDSDELVRRIVTSDLADSLLAGLDAVGVTGIGLIPESLRHVFAFSKPLLSPADFAGVKIRSPRSDTVYETFAALGATADDLRSPDFDTEVADGTVAGAESSYARAGSLPGAVLTVTGNVVLFPKINALVINRDRLGGLDDHQQAVVREAAQRALEGVLGDAIDDAVMAQRHCESLGDVAVASADDLAAFTSAVQPVYDELEADPATKDLITRIRVLKSATPNPAPVAACTHATNQEAPTATDDGQAFPNGTYTRLVTRTDATERGLDPSVVDPMLGDDGVIPISLVIKDGRWTLKVTEDNGVTEVGDLGTYSYDDQGHWVQVSESGGCRGCRASIDWSFTDDVLTLTFAAAQEQRPPTDDERLMVEGDYQLQP